jgi:hypothetical protein
MSPLPASTTLERVAGSVATEGALTVIASMAGGPLAALLPVLGHCLAAERQKSRVEAALIEIDATLRAHEQALDSISDAQYKLINEAILALLHTTAEEKMVYLKRAIRNALGFTLVDGQEAVVLSRVVRDISAAEAAFLCENFGYHRIQVASAEAEHGMKVLFIKPSTPQALIVTGLVSLGVLESAEPTWDESGLLRYSSLTAKLIALLRDAP